MSAGPVVPSRRSRRRAALVVRRIAPPAVFMVGPVIAVTLGGLIFGLPDDLRWAALAAFAVGLALLALLARAEWRLAGEDAGATRPITPP